MKNAIKSFIHHFLFSFFLLLIWNVGYSQTTTYLVDRLDSVNLQFSTISILEDPLNVLTFDQVENSDEFVENKTRIFNSGFSESTYWVKLKLLNYTNLQQKQWVLLVKYPTLTVATLYIRQKDGSIKKLYQGNSLPWFKHLVVYRYPIFHLSLDNPSLTDIYIKMKGISGVQAIISVSNLNHFLQSVMIEQTLFGIYYTSLFLIIIFSLRMFFTLNDWNFLRFAIVVLIYGIMMFLYDGIHYQFVDTSGHEAIYKYLFSTIIGLSGLTFVWFTTSFLGIQQHFSKMAIWTSYTLITLGTLQVIVSLSLPYNITLQINTMLFMFCTFYSWVVSIKSWLKGDKDGQMICIALSAIIFASLFASLIGFGFGTSQLVFQYGLHMGSWLCFLFLTGFSFAKIRKVREAEKEAIHRSLKEYEKRITLSKTFEKFVPKQLLDRINENTLDITLGQAEQDKISVFFADIRNFTGISEKLSPQELLTFLNFYFERCSRIINQHKGVIDKYIGDALLALFDFPHETDNQEAAQAFATAIAIHKKIIKYNPTFQRKYGFDLNIGVGIHSGSVIMGTVGSKMRMDTTILGDAVNIASRLEALTKFYQTFILLSEDTYNLLESKEQTRYIDYVVLPGKSRPIKIFQGFITDQQVEEFYQISKTYHDAIDLYRNQKWQSALELFRNCQKLSQTDSIIKMYLERCQKHITNPSIKWDDIYHHKK